MKLIYCPSCFDIRKMQNRKTFCRCRRSWGRYTDDLNAVYGGEAIPLGIANSSFMQALDNQPNRGMGRKFEAFVIPKICPTCVQLTSTPATDDFSYRPRK